MSIAPGRFRLRLPRTIRLPRGRRRAGWTTAAVILLVAALAVADRLHLFGPTGDDFARYHNGSFRVASAIDGDTIDLDIRDGRRRTTRLRLWGVDTPETHDPRRPSEVDYFGPEAAEFTRRLAEGQTVRVELVQQKVRDKYDRLLAYVWLPDNSMLNERIIEGGFGYADLRFEHPRRVRFKTLERRAERAKAGLWAAVRPVQWPAWRQRMLNNPQSEIRNPQLVNPPP